MSSQPAIRDVQLFEVFEGFYNETGMQPTNWRLFEDHSPWGMKEIKMKQTDAPERWILANRRSVIGLWNRFDQGRVWISGIVCLFLVGGAVPSVSFANVSMPLQEENGDATGSGDTKIADAEKGGE